MTTPILPSLYDRVHAFLAQHPETAPLTAAAEQLKYSAKIADNAQAELNGRGNAAIAYGRGAAIAAELGAPDIATALWETLAHEKPEQASLSAWPDFAQFHAAYKHTLGLPPETRMDAAQLDACAKAAGSYSFALDRVHRGIDALVKSDLTLQEALADEGNSAFPWIYEHGINALTKAGLSETATKLRAEMQPKPVVESITSETTHQAGPANSPTR